MFTSGTHVGIMNVVGDALKDVSHFSSTCSDYIRSKVVRCVGIVPWGIVRDREALVSQDTDHQKAYKKRADYTVNSKMSENNQDCEEFLDPNHTHFLLVDSGSDGKPLTEIPFRMALESSIIKPEPKEGELEGYQNNKIYL